MDIAAMSISLNQAQLKQQAGVSVIKMAMDTAKGQDAALDKLLEASIKALEQSVQPHMGNNIDLHL